MEENNLEELQNDLTDKFDELFPRAGEKKDLFENKDNIYHILGYDKCGIQIGEHLYVPNIKRGSKNVLLAGQYGSGKSTSFVIPNLLNDLGSYIVLDQDGDIYNKTKNTLRERGYRVVKLSDGVSFLSLIKTEDDVDFICRDLLNIVPNYDSFYNPDQELVLFKSVVYFSISVYDKIEDQLNNMITMLTYPQESLIEAFKLLPETHPAYQQFALIKNLPNGTFENIKGNVSAKLGKIIDEEVISIIDNNVIDYEEFYGETRIVFFIDYALNENNKFYARCVLDFFIHALTRKTERDKTNNTYFILNGVDRLPILRALPEAMLVAKNRNNFFSILVTSIELLRLTYKRDDNYIFDSCDTKIYYQSNLYDNQKYFSDLFNDMFVNDFKKIWLDENEMIVFENGLKPIRCRKTYYFNNPSWFGI